MTTALIAEDEALLADALREQLARAWPTLQVLPTASDGEVALQTLARDRPDVVFLDVRMPRRSGLEVAQAIAAGLAQAADYAPIVVFVTAYDQYAIDAFDAAAVDYLLKPVSDERLSRCVARVQARLQPAADGSQPAGGEALARLVQALGAQLGAALPGAGGTRPRFLRASLGDVIRQIPVDEILYLEAQDKYVAVVTRDHTALVRTPLSELLSMLDPERFVQIHRSTVVRLDAIESIRRDITGRQFVHLRETAGGRDVKLAVSRQYAGQFRGL